MQGRRILRVFVLPQIQLLRLEDQSGASPHQCGGGAGEGGHLRWGRQPGFGTQTGPPHGLQMQPHLLSRQPLTAPTPVPCKSLGPAPAPHMPAAADTAAAAHLERARSAALSPSRRVAVPGVAGKRGRQSGPMTLPGGHYRSLSLPGVVFCSGPAPLSNPEAAPLGSHGMMGRCISAPEPSAARLLSPQRHPEPVLDHGWPTGAGVSP